ncbi:two-component sensor histidine kinase [Microbacterium protaetiae]|uniref:histidine kinase n=1 Tax=Microbacterium protaetiae TaxID=2509458 RepID=A0A4P6E909_9MICO|nr:histidine kinase [Microbacterium protaetiae]QAY58632.1 two-component sensor histidine kinase [Microbacterium protaetiae]
MYRREDSASEVNTADQIRASEAAARLTPSHTLETGVEALQAFPSAFLRSRKAALLFALTVFVATLLQVLAVPVTALVEGNREWGLIFPEPVVILLLVVGCMLQSAPLMLADRAPRWTVVLATLTYLALGVGLAVPSWLTGMYLVIALALFLLGTRLNPTISMVWALCVIAVTMAVIFVWLLLIGTSYSTATGFVLGESARFAAPAAGATALGIWWGAQTRRVTRAHEEAALAKEEHAQRVRDAQHEERARIARELHDVAGQHLAGLITLADAALTVAADSPDTALELVGEVRSEGRFAAASLAGALADLQDAGARKTDATATDIRRAPELAAYWRRIGMNVEMSIDGELQELPAVVSSTAYRALQEALTNVAKHSPGSSAHVKILANRERLDVVITNNLPATTVKEIPGISLGWGLAGMRERVELLQGTLTAGANASRQWQLAISIPMSTLL